MQVSALREIFQAEKMKRVPDLYKERKELKSYFNQFLEFLLNEKCFIDYLLDRELRRKK